MTPGRYDIICPQGTTFRKNITYKIGETPVDITGYSSRMQVRESYSSQDFLISLTSSNGITLGGSDGTIDIFISAEETELLPPGTWVYDLELVSSGSIVDRLIQGNFTVTPEVTR
jgi:hypothetical protein